MLVTATQTKTLSVYLFRLRKKGLFASSNHMPPFHNKDLILYLNRPDFLLQAYKVLLCSTTSVARFAETFLWS